MELRRLGEHGPEVSRLALGAMTFGAESDEDATYDLLDAFLEAGGTLVDTADVYSDGVSEEFVGRWLRARAGARDRIVLATKGRFPVTGQPGAGLSAAYLHRALDASLRRLGVERIDLYQTHGADERLGIEELSSFFSAAVASGKVAHVGVSNLPGWQLTKLVHLLRAEPGAPAIVSQQPQYNLLAREVEWEMMPAAVDAGIGAIVWGPLAAGWLTGKYERGSRPTAAGTRLGDSPTRGIEDWDRRGTEHTWTVLDRLRSVAADAGITMAQAAVAWVADRPGVTSAILGARTADQLRQTLPAADLHLDAAATAALDEVSAPPTADYPYRTLAEMAAR